MANEDARARMEERMAAREADRKEKLAGKEEDGQTEQRKQFEKEFATQLREITDMCDGFSALSSIDTSQLDQCGEKIEALHGSLAKMAVFLPAATLRSCTVAVTELEQRLRAERERLMPKKKFAFKNRNKVGATAVPTPSKEQPTISSVSNADSISAKHADGFAAVLATCPGFRDAQDQQLVRPAGEDASGDYALSGLRRCRIWLLSASTALWIRDLQDCVLTAVPVAGAIYISECKNCVFAIAGRQIRIHTSTACDAYVHVSSHPILEHCREFRFAPYPALPPAHAGALAAAGLKPEHNMWDQANDFDWLKAQQSPHWCILPEAERNPQLSFAP
uniref:C-CAP/cofactor C-like domain-containing protein n=1 Tax=Chrysotila carterae TaxID=13221 RepID=A0A7S4FA02_CHRCT|mmetsp:Transcript_47237/g.102585  ORF Transcript_47237/g.102585 Transcript_47237/m.102585 type:complete len:335 (-) Transcript_47237:220-1224(-)